LFSLLTGHYYTKIGIQIAIKKGIETLSYHKSFHMRNFAFLPVFLLFLSCNNQSNKSNGDTTSVRNEIKSTIDSYYSDIRKEGMLAGLKYMDSSSQFFWVPPGYLNYTGYDSIAAAIRRNAASFKSISNRYDSLLVIPLTDRYANFVMRTISTTVGAAGDTSRTAFIESGVMVKKDDRWKFLSGQTSVLE
jgi:hypothetical protein